MALDDLIKHIESEAQKEFDKIISDTEKQLTEFAEKFNDSKKQLLESYEKKLEEEKKKELSSALTAARVKERIEILTVKRKILDDFFNKLWERISASDSDSKKRIYEKLFKGIDQDKTAELIVSKRDSALWSNLKKELAHSKFSESESFLGGFIYKTEISTLDYTLENLFASFRQISETELASEIFKNH